MSDVIDPFASECCPQAVPPSEATEGHPPQAELQPIQGHQVKQLNKGARLRVGSGMCVGAVGSLAPSEMLQYMIVLALAVNYTRMSVPSCPELAAFTPLSGAAWLTPTLVKDLLGCSPP